MQLEVIRGDTTAKRVYVHYYPPALDLLIPESQPEPPRVNDNMVVLKSYFFEWWGNSCHLHTLLEVREDLLSAPEHYCFLLYFKTSASLGDYFCSHRGGTSWIF